MQQEHSSYKENTTHLQLLFLTWVPDLDPLRFWMLGYPRTPNVHPLVSCNTNPFWGARSASLLTVKFAQIMGPDSKSCLARFGNQMWSLFGKIWLFSCARSDNFLSISVCQIWLPFWAHPIWELFHIFCQFWGPDFGPYLDPKNGYQKWSPIKNIRESKFWTPKTDPNLVPKTGPQNSYFWSKTEPKN